MPSIAFNSPDKVTVELTGAVGDRLSRMISTSKSEKSKLEAGEGVSSWAALEAASTLRLLSAAMTQSLDHEPNVSRA
jgi:hypothetical protein